MDFQAVLTGILLWFITELNKFVNKKLGIEIDSRIILAILSLVIGTVYYYINKTDPELVKKLTEFMTQSFVVSQSMYLFLSKLLESKKN